MRKIDEAWNRFAGSEHIGIYALSIRSIFNNGFGYGQEAARKEMQEAATKADLSGVKQVLEQFADKVLTDRQLSNVLHGREADDNGEFTASAMGAAFDEPIPGGICWNVDFQQFQTTGFPQASMTRDFYDKWIERRDEFPQQVHDEISYVATPVRSEALFHQKLGRGYRPHIFQGIRQFCAVCNHERSHVIHSTPDLEELKRMRDDDEQARKREADIMQATADKKVDYERVGRELEAMKAREKAERAEESLMQHKRLMEQITDGRITAAKGVDGSVRMQITPTPNAATEPLMRAGEDRKQAERDKQKNIDNVLRLMQNVGLTVDDLKRASDGE